MPPRRTFPPRERTPTSQTRVSNPTPLPTGTSNPTPPPAQPTAEVEDFGRDKDIKNLLKTLQPKAFNGEGSDVPKELEEWIMSMEDYFDLAGYNPLAQGVMGRAKLGGSAKLWWKLSCQSRGVAESVHSWEILKKLLQERYLPLNYATNKMNEFLSYNRKGQTVETYYEGFVKLSRHAPLMSEEQKLSRFILGLEGKLADEVESLRPSNLADALIRAQSKLNSLQHEASSAAAAEARKRDFPPPTSFRPSKAPYVPTTVNRPPAPRPPMPVTAQVRALPVSQSEGLFSAMDAKNGVTR